MPKLSLNVKNTSLAIGAGQPAPIGKYGATPRPQAPTSDTPRAKDIESSGTTPGYRQRLTMRTWLAK